MATGKKFYSGKERLRIIQELEASGLEIGKFCQKKGIPYSTLAWWREKHRRGESLENQAKTGPQDPAKRIQAVEAFYKSGMTQTDFARTYGVSKNTISRWLMLCTSSFRPTLRSEAWLP